MSTNDTLSTQEILTGLHRHPRVAYQKLGESSEDLKRLADSLVPLVAFGDASYHGGLAVLDWDHRLPSRGCILRMLAYYTEEAMEASRQQIEARSKLISARDRYPEFDVPDFSGLIADEAYEAEVNLDGSVARIRLISPWRRDIGPEEGRSSVNITRESPRFRKLLEEGCEERPECLGDLEAVAWTPPCETNFQRWTVDVWYLTHLDTAIGRGQSFLVDLHERKVVGVREFVVRAGG
jgi:hypothetical protein